MYTLKPTVSATAAAAKALAMRRNENVKVCRDSIFCHNVGMKFALGSGVGHAANARKRASSFSSLLPRIGIMSFDPQEAGFIRHLPFSRPLRRLSKPAAGL